MKNFINKISFVTILLFFATKISISQVSITSPTASPCPSKAVDGSAPGWTTLGNIVIDEGSNNDFPKKTATFILSAPSGWVFNTAATLTISTNNQNIVYPGGIGITSITSSAITFTWTAGGTNKDDIVTLAGIQVQASSMLSPDGPIYCSTSSQPINGITAGVQGTGTQLAYLSQIKNADAGGYQTICTTTATMTANNPAPGTGAWTFVSGPVTPTLSSTTSYSAGVSGITTNGSYTYKWTTTTSCGTTSANVVITKTTTPASAAGTDVTMCMPNSTVLGANFPSVGSGVWSIVAGSANTSLAQFSSTTNESATFTPASVGTYSLVWSISLSGCTTNTDVVIITAQQGPNTSNAGTTQTICATGSAALSANTASSTCTGAWSVSSGPSTLLSQFSNTASPTSNFTPAGGGGTYVLAWTITKTSTGCTSVSTKTVIVNPAPTTASAGATQSVCTVATLSANTPAVGTGSWTVVSGSGTFSDPTDPFSTYTPASQNVANTLQWTISSPGCTSSTSTVVITATCIATTTLSIPSNSTTTTVGLTGCPSTKILYDNGGPSANYSASALGTVTFTSPVGTCMSYSFTSFNTESSYDELTLTVGATTLGVYSGSSIPPSGVTTSNTLTVRFESDGSVQYAGFQLSVSCANACSAGSISGGTAVATPTVRCSTYTTNLSLSGGSSLDCGITYQWQSSTTSSVSGFSNIAGATAKTATASVSATTWYRCVLACSGTTVASAAATASLQGGGCGCPTSITLPYSTTGQTTCGQGNDITSSNVNTVNGSSSYYTGEDVVYTFTASTTGQITVDLTSSGSYTGLMLYRNCPTAAGTATVANAQGWDGDKTLCASVTAGQVYYLIIDSYASPTCNPYDLTITAPTGTAVACNMAYTPATTTYSFESFTGTALPTTDDVLFDVSINFGFPICFDGVPYTSGYVASNGALVFDAVQCFPNISSSTIASGGVSTGYTIPNPAPVNGTSIPRNAILAPWHDIHPGLGTGLMQYTTLGTAPNRRFIVSYENIPMYSCGTSSTNIYFSSQIKVFETTNDIEIHVRKKAVCPGWNNGQAVLGLHNFDGTIYVPPVNATVHNAVASPGPYNQWTMSNTAYKYTTTCGSTGPCAVVLPLGLVNFYGERVDKINNLYWQTSSEERLIEYSVQRSTDGVNFIEIGIVTANNTPSKYHFEDKFSVPGVINYYRVIVHEENGTESSTNIISLLSGNDEVLTVSQLYPNPTTKNFMIGLDSKQKGQATINVYDMFGKIVVSSSHEVHGGINQYTINTEDLALGVYYVEVLNSFNEIISKQKLIKE